MERRDYTVEEVFVGSAGHLTRYKVLDVTGKFVPGGLFRSYAAAYSFIVTKRFVDDLAAGYAKEES